MNRNILFIIAMTFSIFLVPVIGCNDDPPELPEDDNAEPVPEPVRSVFGIDEQVGFFGAPYPSEHMRRKDGTIRFDRFPNIYGNKVVQYYLDLANEKTNGFSRAGAIYLPFNGPINEENLPADLFESLNDESSVFLVNLDPESPEYGNKIPIYAQFQVEGSRYIPGNMLKLLPYQGYPLAPNAMYAAVVLTSLGGANGRELAPAQSVEDMANHVFPLEEFGRTIAENFVYLWNYCEENGIERDQVVTAALFRTGDFVTEMAALQKSCAALPDPMPYDLEPLAEFEKFYVIRGKMVMPIWQNGHRSYWGGGGEILFFNGEPVHQWDEEIRFSVTIPKTPMPENGYPLMFYSNGQGGTYTQIIDRGGIGDLASVPGTGPAREFANRGIACLDIEAATVGPRNPINSYEGIAFFNFINLVALRDNIRQAASEFTMLPKMARNLEIPAEMITQSDVGDGPAFFDTDNFFFWGHSTGSSIGDLVLAVEPAYKAGMVSGAGVSWIYNLIYKQEPLPLGDVFALLTEADELDEFHPLATLFQTVCDGGEAAYFAQHWIEKPLVANRPVNTMIVMGIFDRYFPPQMIDGLIVAAGVDLAGPVAYSPTLEALEISGKSALPLPVTGNINQYKTAVALQYQMPEDLDAHYAPFYLPEAKYQYSCFFASLAQTGTPIVPIAKSDAFAPCGFE